MRRKRPSRPVQQRGEAERTRQPEREEREDRRRRPCRGERIEDAHDGARARHRCHCEGDQSDGGGGELAGGTAQASTCHG
ncbi:hypothetical protein AB5I41_17285 [Sphingomonas sp. MMS24-JH45]